MLVNSIISSVAFILSLACFALFWELMFYRDNSEIMKIAIRFPKLKNWIDPEVSWRNKYNISGNKFITLIFSTCLVGVTDAFHFLQSLYLSLLIISVSVWMEHPVIMFIIYRASFGLWFEIWLLILNKKK